jgi:uncharacterized membrane protein
MSLSNRNLLIAVKILAVAGVVVAGVSFAHNQAIVSGEFCTIGESFNCDIVNQGPYSKIMGIPVSIIGVIGYIFMAIAAFLKLRQPADRMVTAILFASAAGGMAFSLYLTGIEAFVLHTWCMLCLTSQAIIALIAVASGIVFFRERKTPHAS